MKRSELNRREFLKQAAAGAAVATAWIYAGELAVGQIPWEQELETVALADEASLGIDSRAELGEGLRVGYPRICFDDGERLCAVWVEERDEIDQVFYTQKDSARFSGETLLSDPANHATHPRIARVGDRVVVVWTERTSEGWAIRLRRLKGGTVQGAAETLASSEKPLWRPALAGDGKDKIIVAWEQLSAQSEEGDKFAIGYASGKLGSLTARLYKAHNADLCRPACVFDSKGNPWIAWDQETGPGSKQIFLSPLKDGEISGPVQVTHHPAASIHPSIAGDGDGNIWIAFQSNRRNLDEWDIPRWIYTMRYDGRRFHQPAAKPVAMNLEKEGTDQSFEFPSVLCASDGRVIVMGRPSHNFCIQQYHGNEWSPLYRVPVDGWGGRGKYMDGVLDKEGNLWIVRRDIRGNVVQKVTGLQKDRARISVIDSTEEQYRHLALSNIQKAPRRWDAYEEFADTDESLNVYYGDLHGHTWTSDGVGDVDEYYYYRRDYYEDDFGSLTDHDFFVGQHISPSDWELQKAITDHYNQSGKFVTLFGQEWTTARYPIKAGHKCIFSTDPKVPLFNNTRQAYGQTRRLYAELKKWNCIAIPHHTGWTGTDWENFDPEVQVAAEIVSNHGRFEFMGNRPIRHRGGVRGGFLQDGLARNCRFGIIGGSDGHGLIWHHRVGWKRDCNRTGLACVLAKELTREAIFDAIRKRRVFASSGNKPRLDFRVNEHIMGSEFQTADSKVEIRVDVTARENLKWLTVVKNNKDWYEYGGENFRSRFTIADDELEPGTSFYYLRVEFQDGNMAWSSPIWVTRTA